MTITFHSRRLDGTWDKDSLQPFSFPAGEAHIKIAEGFKLSDYDHFVADVRGHNPQDLFHLALWENIVDSEGDVEENIFPEKTIFLPYIPAARADRGLPFGAQVYTEFLHGLFIQNYIVIDPHSPVALDLLRAGESTVIEFPFERIIKHSIQDKTSDSRPQTYAGVTAPDHGAVDRATRAANVMGVPVYRAGKTRDFETGQLTGFHMEDELPAEGRFLIVDDICDGGGTFNGLADAIGLDNTRLDLWVTHGVFSKGLEELGKRFGTIHTTDSYYTDSTPTSWVKVHSITSHFFGELR